MGYITKSRLDSITENRKKHFSKGLNAPAILNEAYNSDQKYDIFLSHSYLDKERVASLKKLLEYYGFSVYVDWFSDKHLNREAVNKCTADRIRNRMKNCRCLLYAVSDNSSCSKWMPWELGYFDGINGTVAIIPITNNVNQSLVGIEYLSLYPVVKENRILNRENNALWIYEPEDHKKYIIINHWIKGHQLISH